MLDHRPILAPLIAPYTDDSSQVSEVRVARLVRWHLERGADGLVIGSAVGEPHALALTERRFQVDVVIREAKGKPVFLQVPAWTTAATLDLLQHAAGQGVAGAIVIAPPSLDLRDHELKSLIHAVRRHAGLSATLLHGADQFTPEVSDLRLESLAGAGLPILALHKQLDATEMIINGSLLSPAAIFGADALRKMAPTWPMWKLRLQAILKFGLPRVAKAWMQESGLDLGPPRPPMMELEPEGRALLASLKQALNQV